MKNQRSNWEGQHERESRQITTVNGCHCKLSGYDKIKWQEAMRNEMRSLRENNVWDLVELPKDKKAIGSKWVFKLKTNTDGSVERYKAQLVAQGFSQTSRSD